MKTQAEQKLAAAMSRAHPERVNIDVFAGGGGASLGMEWAGCAPSIALNHDPEAIAMHQLNHPNAIHICQDVFDAKPKKVTRGKPVYAAWFSPDCTHHSKAKGGKPLDNKRRALAWIVVDYARDVRPTIIFLENVEEFADWGPLDRYGRPIKSRRGETFHEWLAQLQALGYVVEWRELAACDYGAPTTRNRLFLVARCDGLPIVWPKPTHSRGGRGGLKPYRTAAEIIDWSLPCPSIFMTREEAREYYRQTGIRVQRPLKPKTMARIAKGVWRYVINAKQPFIVSHYGDRRDSDVRAAGLDGPLPTVTASRRHALVAPYFVPRYGERPDQEPRTSPVDQPMPTIVPKANGATLVAAFLAQHNNDRGTEPNAGHDAREPMSSITTRAQQGIVAAHLINLKGDGRSRAADEPMFTACSGGNHLAEVRAFLIKYYGTAGGASLLDPLDAVTCEDRFGLVTVAGVEYQIVDIGMRMLNERELARGQGLPDDYQLRPVVNGKPISSTSAVRMIGNSVSPYPAAALVRENIDPDVELKMGRRRAA